jgi:hypothetical protein
MPERTELSLDALRADPALALDLDPREAAGLLAAVEGLAAVLRQRIPAARHEANGAGSGAEPDRFLTAAQVGERLGLTERQVYRRKALRAFEVPKGLGEATLRFSARGLEHYIAWAKEVDRPAVT